MYSVDRPTGQNKNPGYMCRRARLVPKAAFTPGWTPQRNAMQHTAPKT